MMSEMSPTLQTADQNKLSLYKLIQIRDLVFKNFPVAKPGAVKCKNK